MKTRTVVLILIGTLIVSGLLAGLFAPSITAALTLPATGMQKQANNIQPPPVATHQSGVSASPSPTMPTTTRVKALAQDTFQRPDQTFWGMASDGQSWQGAANQNQNFSIVNKTGLINGQGFFEALLGEQATDAEILFSSSLTSFQQANIGAVLRWQDTNNWYKAYLDGQKLIILRKFQGVVQRLGDTPFVAQPQTSYDLRFQILGNRLATRVWKHGTNEPANWMVIAQDNDLTSGLGGVRAFISSGITIKVSSFAERSLQKK